MRHLRPSHAATRGAQQVPDRHPSAVALRQRVWTQPHLGGVGKNNPLGLRESSGTFRDQGSGHQREPGSTRESSLTCHSLLCITTGWATSSNTRKSNERLLVERKGNLGIPCLWVLPGTTRLQVPAVKSGSAQLYPASAKKHDSHT